MLDQVRGGHKQAEERILKVKSEINEDSDKLAKIEEEIKQNDNPLQPASADHQPIELNQENGPLSVLSEQSTQTDENVLVI